MNLLDDLEALIKEATRQAFKDKIEPLIENEEERERQKKTADDTKALSSGKKSGDLDEAEDDEEKKGDDDVSAKAALGKSQDEDSGDTPTAVMPTVDDMAEANVDHIINMLNMLRSGKSTKDEAVKKSLADYFDGLQPGDRQALFVLMSGLTQILTSGVEGGQAPAPAKVGIRISAKKKVTDAESADQEIQKAAKDDQEGKDAEAESAPIVVGEAQSKDWIYRILERNRS